MSRNSSPLRDPALSRILSIPPATPRPLPVRRGAIAESRPMLELPCYYSLSSPWAYFAGPRLQDIVRRHRVTLVLKPYDFQAVVPRTGGVPLRTRPEPR